MQNNIELERCIHVTRFINEYIENIEDKADSDKDFKKKSYDKLISYSKKLPTQIKVNGLIATLAFVKGKFIRVSETKSSDSLLEYNYIYRCMDSWYKSLFDTKNDVLDDLLRGNNDFKRLITREITTLALWLKRISIAQLDY